MKLFNLIASSVAVAMAAGVAQADVSQAQLANLQAQINQLQAQVSSGASASSSLNNIVGVNPNLSWQMMGNKAGVGKEMYLLQARQAGGLSTPITIGGFAQGDYYYRHLNTAAAAQFAPVASHSTTHLQIPNVALATTASIGDWANAYIQAGAKNLGEQNTNLNGADSDKLSIQNAYLVVGNLAKNPVYGFIGKKDIDFGSFETVDMYSQPLNRQLFSALGNTAGVGINAEGFNGTFSVMNGGNGNNLYAANTNTGRNFAANASYGMTNNGVTWKMGAGYLNGTQFTNTTGGTNGAWDLNGKVSANGFDLLAEYTQTAKKTNGATPFVGAMGNLVGISYFQAGTSSPTHVNAWDVGADYNFPIQGMNSMVSAEYSTAKLGSVNGKNIKPQQAVAGFSIEPVTNVRTGIEYAYTKANLTSINSGKPVASMVLLDASAAF